MKLEVDMDDHMDDHVTDGSPRGVSKRRANKHLIERRRRARINSSLTQLKSLVLEGLKKDPACYNRLEKADILEMTVNHLKTLKSQQNDDGRENLVTRYQAGFTECASEIAHFLNNIPKIEDTVKTNILSHMNDCLVRMGESLGVADTKGNTAMVVEPPHDPSLPLDLSMNGAERLKQSHPETPIDLHSNPTRNQFSVALGTNCDVISALPLTGSDVIMKKETESVDSGLDDEVSSNDDQSSNEAKTDDSSCAQLDDNRDLDMRQDDMWRPW